ncbi:MAG: hypothetical protein J6Z11_00480 [Candidatus Riflebacteria bacterium]|nr:hypothetical protein [Candidatus Riflebacteria bacterium]
MVISKKEFVGYMEFIEKKSLQQEKFCKALEELSPETHCDVFLYSDYETKLVRLLEIVTQDHTNLISYRLYDFNCFDAKRKAKMITECPELESWETVYDYLEKDMEALK